MDRYLTLEKGKHPSPSDGMCVMEAVAWWFGEDHTDEPRCVSPVLRSYAMTLNDRMPDDQRQKLLPFIPRFVGTRDDGLDQERAEMAALRAVNVFAAAGLRAVGLDEHAEACKNADTLNTAAYAAAAVAALADAHLWDEALQLLDDMLSLGARSHSPKQVRQLEDAPCALVNV